MLSCADLYASGGCSYVEVHMEQGPILEAKGLPLGVVTGIAGQTRQYVMMSGTQVTAKLGLQHAPYPEGQGKLAART